MTGPSSSDASEGFARALDAALAGQPISLSALRDRLSARGLAVSIATLSYWRSGARRPEVARSRDVIEAIEDILALPAGTLMKHASGRSRRLGTVSRLNDPPLPADEVLQSLDAAPAENVRYLSINETVLVDDRGAVAQVDSVVFLQCVSGTVGALAYVVDAAGPTSTHPELTVIAGGVIDRRHVRPDGLGIGYRILLDRELTIGETALLSLRFDFPDSYPVRRAHETSVRRPVRELTQLVQFAPGFTPEWADETEVSRGQRRIRDLAVEGSRSISAIRFEFGPGSLRIRWGSDDDD